MGRYPILCSSISAHSHGRDKYKFISYTRLYSWLDIYIHISTDGRYKNCVRFFFVFIRTLFESNYLWILLVVPFQCVNWISDYYFVFALQIVTNHTKKAKRQRNSRSKSRHCAQQTQAFTVYPLSAAFRSCAFLINCKRLNQFLVLMKIVLYSPNEHRSNLALKI